MPGSRKKQEGLRRLFSEIAGACRASGALKGAVPVYGEGPASAALMIIGEAPGRDETRLGSPFVGKAGRFLTSVIEEVFKMPRSSFYITNVVKVWPVEETLRRKTRKPSASEEAFFRPYLMREVEIVAPLAVVAVGKTAFKALVPDAGFIPGEWVEAPGLPPVMPVYHPSYILRKQKSLKENTRALKAAFGKVKKRLAV